MALEAPGIEPNALGIDYLRCAMMRVQARQQSTAFCSARQLPEIVGVTQRQIERLTASRVLKVTRGKLRNRYRLADSVQRFLNYQCDVVREKSASNNDEYEIARTRRMTAAAESAELDLQLKKGKLHRQDDIEFCLTQMLTAFRQRTLAIPSRVMHRLLGLTNARQANQIVDDEIRLALNELSEGKFKDSVEFRRAKTAYVESRGLPPEIIEQNANRDGQDRPSVHVATARD